MSLGLCEGFGGCGTPFSPLVYPLMFLQARTISYSDVADQDVFWKLGGLGRKNLTCSPTHMGEADAHKVCLKSFVSR